MRKYDKDKEKEIIICNGCGKIIAAAENSDKAAFLSVRQRWGYFSKWDGCSHSFELCENCYEKMTENWIYPPDMTEETELI